ncbi:glycerate kinase [Herbiconiux sp. P17]|uniref:glycerate kinase n=1 Tax=Herbiconiux wuyangfengii TaxID=3342794 RepID=UPI0035B76770
MSRRRVVVAPDSFKGTATAIEVADSLAAGWREVHPSDDVRCLPMADGGEGALDAFAIARPDARRMPVTVTGPDDRAVEAYWLLLPGPDGDAVGGTGVVELANTSGITLLHPLRPLEAHSIGFGQAIRAALDAGVDRLVLAIGGSSSTDGGAGVLQVLGAQFVGVDGVPVPSGNGGLGAVVRASFEGLVPLPPGGVSVLSDVTNPLLGRLGAVTVFGPQKGIGDGLSHQAEANLENFATVVTDARGTDPREPGTGAAGGVGFGLVAWGAELTAGASAVGAEVGLPALIADADIVLTGEGRYDHQSESGKVPSYVRGLAREAGARTGLVAGALEASPRDFDAAVSLTDLAGSGAAAMADTLHWLREAGRHLAAELS